MKNLLLFVFLANIYSLGNAEPSMLGRLFLTPEQRNQLDLQRKGVVTGSVHIAEAKSSLTLNGEVKRSDGHHSRWVNGELVPDASESFSHIPIGDSFIPQIGERRGLLGEGNVIIKSNR